MATMTELTLTIQTTATPTGEMIIAADQAGLMRLLEWTTHRDRMMALLARQYPGMVVRVVEGQVPTAMVDAVAAYHAGALGAFDGIKTATGGTAFQREVWAGLRTIPAGSTLSYQCLANRIGRPKAMRAVGAANGANPLAIIVPCHRVIGADGSLTGYGGGMARKEWLLRHEGVLL
jgi:methylated-DNA-[protein]-cysteine S-methyltransferase